MAEPISFIRKNIPTEEEIHQQKLDELKTLLTAISGYAELIENNMV